MNTVSWNISYECWPLPRLVNFYKAECCTFWSHTSFVKKLLKLNTTLLYKKNSYLL